MICYKFRKLNDHEKIYVTHDIELEMFIHALNMWRHSLLGRRFVLVRNHIGFIYFLTKKI